MPYYYQSRDIHIYRPLLAYRREALEAYAKFAHLSWVVDESNLSNQFSRNYLRNEILPLIEKRWPQYRQSLSHTINHCQETGQVHFLL
jgi:tRNA(Ile)-lysidine synthase